MEAHPHPQRTLTPNPLSHKGRGGFTPGSSQEESPISLHGRGGLGVRAGGGAQGAWPRTPNSEQLQWKVKRFAWPFCPLAPVV